MRSKPFRRGIRIIVYGALGAMLWVSVGKALRNAPFNGFDVSNAAVPSDQIRLGGPPRDGIPAIDRPRFVDANAASYLALSDRVLGVAIEGAARAYPIRILNWHEIVNDRIGERAVLVTYCPLCGTGMVFAVAPGSRFGVSGLLYNSDMLLYDRASESLWSQIQSQAISGPRRGERLTALPAEHTTWEDWRQRHPTTRVLSTETGFDRDYNRDPYQGYAASDRLYFSVSNLDQRYHPKAQVIGLQLGDTARVWPYQELARSSLPLADSLGGKDLKVHYDPAASRAWITDARGNPLAATTGFWFAWMAFHPGSTVYQGAHTGKLQR